MKTLKALVILICLAGAAPAAAFDTGGFARIPVMHEGRIKPLGVFAQIHLRKFSGDAPSPGKSAQFLASMLFDPAGAEKWRGFAVKDAALVTWMGLPERSPARYSFAELNAAFIRQSKTIAELQKTDPDHAVLQLYARVTAFEQIKDSMTAFLPLKAANGATAYAIDRKKRPSAEERKHAEALKKRGAHNVYFLVIPKDGTWQTPWQAVLSGKDDALLPLWREAARLYLGGKEKSFARQGGRIADRTTARAEKRFLGTRLRLEIFYRTLHPELIAAALYLAAAILLMTQMRAARYTETALLAALGFHGFALLCRMVILLRPPVSSLHESFLFVGFVAAAGALAWHRRSRDKAALASAAWLGLALQCVAFLFAGADEDDLKVLQAVLDTKFWLAVHVTVITAGYAFCLLSSAAAHAVLIGGASGRLKNPLAGPLRRYAQGLAIVALCLVTLGTVLGGIWADQSWGRFWGWDPKENGALLIILWITWLLHGRLTQQVSVLGLMIGLAALSIVVALSWIGVNLLGVGLHAYGFTSGSGVGLGAFVAAEILLLSYCFARLRRGDPHGA